MTRYKKFLRSKGHKLEHEYPYIPWDGYGRSSAPALDGVRTWYDSQKKCVTLCDFYVVGNSYHRYYADGREEHDFY